jgi:hypothetical protein
MPLLEDPAERAQLLLPSAHTSSNKPGEDNRAKEGEDAKNP